MKVVLDIAFFFPIIISLTSKTMEMTKKQEMICSSNCAQSMLFDCVRRQLLSLKVIIIIVIVSLHVSSIVDFASTLTLINVA